MKYIFAICFLWLPMAIVAQAPGYMGKRLAVDANFHSMASPLSAIRYDNSGIRFRYKLNLQLEYSINRIASLGIHYDHISHASTIGSSASFFNTYPAHKGENLGYEIQAHGIGFNYRKYTRGALSPAGSFFQIYSTFVTSSILASYRDYEIITDEFGNEQTGEQKIFQKKGPVTAVVVGIGFGKRIIFADRFTFNFGINMGIPCLLNGESKLASLDSEEVPEGWESAKAYIRRNYNLSTTVGFGILL